MDYKSGRGCLKLYELIVLMPLIEFINVEWIYSTNKLRELCKPELSERNFSSLILIELISISIFMLLGKKIKITLPVVLAASLNQF